MRLSLVWRLETPIFYVTRICCLDGIRLCKAKRLRFKHMDMEDLTRSLEEARDCRIKLIATDGVFSMDGKVSDQYRQVI